MNKKRKIIIAVVLILVLAIAGYLWYKKVQEDRMGPVSFDSFEKIEIDGKVFMENKDIGLKFMVPDGWEVVSTDIASLSMYSSDFVPFQDPSFIPKKGCWIDVAPKVQIEGSKYDLQYTYYRQVIDDEEVLNTLNQGNDKCEIVDLDGLKFAKEIYSNNNSDNQGEYIGLTTPYNNVVYRFNTYIFGQDKEKCVQEFNNFLSTISIKKK
ncbi:MAG: hypothetical protein WA091_03550 [Minisyncoccales bacterium]